MATPMQVPEPATSRIVRLTNVHFKATNDEIKAFFPAFTIESLFRTINVKTGKKSVAYILFSTVAEKNQACAMSGLWIRDREINVLPAAANSNYELNDDGTAFIAPKKTTTAAVEADNKSPTINDTNFPALGAKRLPQGQKSPKEPAGASKAETSTADPKIETETGVENKGAGRGTELVEGLSSLSLEPVGGNEAPVETRIVAPEGETSNTLAVGADDDSPRQRSPEKKLYPLFKAGDLLPPPPATFDNFSLAGNDANDPTKSFPTGASWYNFQADQFAKVEQDHREQGTNASRINNAKVEDDYDDDDDVLLGGS